MLHPDVTDLIGKGARDRELGAGCSKMICILPHDKYICVLLLEKMAIYCYKGVKKKVGYVRYDFEN